MIRNIIKLAALALASTQVSAATMSYDMTFSNDLADGPAYLTVTISDVDSDSTLAADDIGFEIVVNTGLFPGVPTAGTGNFGMDNFYFNYDNSLTVDAINISNMDPSTWNITTDKNAGGGFGFFDFNLSGTGNSRTETLAFSISNVSGDDIASYAIGYVDKNGNVGDAYFAAHVGGFNAGNNITSAKFATVVPVPAAVWLFGSGLLGLVGIARRKRA